MGLLTRTSTTPETTTDSPDSEMADPPMFGPPRAILPGPANPDPAPPTSTSTRATSPAAADEPGGRGAGGGSKDQTASIPGLFKQRSKSYAKVAETLLKAAGGWLHTSAGLGDDSEAFLPDEDDLDTIPPPLGRLAARRIKLGADPDELSDIEDIGIAAVGILVWLAKGFSGVLEARRARRRLEKGKAVHDETGDGQ